jgi:Tol biopolymer transport system component
LSPDGRFVAYLEGEKGLRDVHVVSLDGRQAYRITDDPADDLRPIWSHDGRHLAFTSNRLGSVSLWSVEIKDGKPAGPPVKLKDGMQSARVIDWAKRGIFYSQGSEAWNLYTVAVDPVDGRATGAPRPIPYSRTGRNVSPVWSPDGETLAFVSSAASEPNRRYVVVMPANGGQGREFLIPTTTWEYSQSPADLRWFGNGRGLGFSGTDNRGSVAVFRLLLETGEWTTIPLSDASRTRTEWNRDGSAFYFTRQGGGIFERRVNGDVERPAYRPSGPAPVLNIQSLEFSPDRKWLAFRENALETNDTLKQRVLVLDVETGETRTLLADVIKFTDSSTSNLVGWTPSGNLIVQRFRTEGASQTLVVPVNGGTTRSIAIPGFASRGTGETPRDLIAKWSPDGRSMVLGRVSRGSETFVIENPLAAIATTVSR